MKPDPISGPMPREKFAELVNSPCGEAQNIIRQYDPFWGLAPGEKIDFEVEVRADVVGYAVVTASSLEEAKKLAGKLLTHEIEFDTNDLDPHDWTVETVNPVKPALRRKKTDAPF